ncbi:MAG: amidohydrolase [Defluviicoccus sp.]|nr:amidohydrolase [Defluviicoccus sp.]
MPAPADLVVTRGKVITADPKSSIAEAVAVSGGRISAVGGAAEIETLVGPGTRRIDAGGRAVTPGLIDGHAHLDREGLKPVFPSLAGCRSIDDVLGRIQALAADAEPGEWIVTMPIGEPPYYWDVPSNLAEGRFPTRRELDGAAPDNPVYIRPIWGFWRHILPLTSVANSAALDAAGIGRDTPDPSASIRIERDPGTGEPNGIIHEHTYMPVIELSHFNRAPRFTHADRVAGIEAAMRIYNRTGTTSVFEEHGAAQELIQAWQAVHAAGRATVRANLVFSPSWGPERDIDYTHALRSWSGWLGGRGLGDDWLAVGGLYTEFGFDADALLRARASPYTGWSGFNYDCGVPREKMVDFLTEAARNSIRICALWPQFLPLFEEVNKRVPIGEKRWVLGHINTLSPDEIRRVADLGLVLTTHTNRYVHKQSHITRDEIGADRENDIVPIRSLLEAGVHVALATDNVPTSLFFPVWQSVARENLHTGERIAPDQALTREDAMRCATIEGAWLTFEEDSKGSLEEGKLADMAILSDDPLTCPEDAIKDIVAETVIVGGTVVHEG